MYTFVSNTENDTIKFAENIANKLSIGDIVILSGDLGSGKTKFVQGFLKKYNLDSEISSPTFTIVNEYNTNINNKLINIYHFDVYRLDNIDDFFAIGGDEYFTKGICLIEWGELIECILPKEYLKISFSKDFEYENKRILNIETHGEKFKKILEDII